MGSMLATAIIKLSPIQRRLTELEITNIRDFFNSDFISPERRRQLNGASAFMMAYFHAIGRTWNISKLARQDYYALMRQGCFAVKELPDSIPAEPNEHHPVLIIPGLNTPPVFFREMHSYFTSKGYPVVVMNLPSNGLADVESSAQALQDEIERIKETYGVSKVNIIGHCLGGLIAHYWLEAFDVAKNASSVKHLVSLGTGFMGAEGVKQLKNIWIPNNPGKPVPRVFDQLVEANMNMVRYSTDVVRHNLLTVWDFMVHFRKGIMDTTAAAGGVFNHIIEDPAIDHLTLALNHSVFQRVEAILSGEFVPGEGDLPGEISRLLPAGKPALVNVQ